MTQTAETKPATLTRLAACTVFVPTQAGGWHGTSGAAEAREIFDHLALVTFHEGAKTFAVTPGNGGVNPPAAGAEPDTHMVRQWTLWARHSGSTWFAMTAGAHDILELEEPFKDAIDSGDWNELRIVPPLHSMPAALG